MANFKVTVFGGSNSRSGEPDYEQAYKLGQMLGAAGYIVITGGYIGAMEATSRGAAEMGGHVIGITCDEIEVWRPIGPNPWVMEERRYPTLRERLFALIDSCDAAFALPGGIGTLTEIVLTWNSLVIRAITPRPLITIGNSWKRIIDAFTEEMNNYLPNTARQLITCFTDVDTAVKFLTRNYPNSIS